MPTANHRGAGFTLIQLMIAIAVVAILAAVAIPSYQSYTVRTKATECLNLAAYPKIAVSESHASGRSINYEGGMGGSAGDDEDPDEGEEEECEHRLPNGRPHPGKCG